MANYNAPLAINRIYAIGIPRKLKKAMLMLSSGSNNVYEGAIYEYRKSFIEYMNLEDIGIYKTYGTGNNSKKLLQEIEEAGNNL